MRFWGYDSAIECAFFVTRSALERLVASLLPEEPALLAAFDRNRELICRAATRVYSRGRRGSYELDARGLLRPAAEVSMIKESCNGIDLALLHCIKEIAFGRRSAECSP